MYLCCKINYQEALGRGRGHFSSRSDCVGFMSILWNFMEKLGCGSKRVCKNSAAEIGFVVFDQKFWPWIRMLPCLWKEYCVIFVVCVGCPLCPCPHLMFQPLRGWHLTAAPFLTIMLARVSDKTGSNLSWNLHFFLIKVFCIYFPCKRGYNVQFSELYYWILLCFLKKKLTPWSSLHQRVVR